MNNHSPKNRRRGEVDGFFAFIFLLACLLGQATFNAIEKRLDRIEARLSLPPMPKK